MLLAQTTETFGVEDQSWLGSEHGTSSARTITLDTSAFTAGTHYPNGFFPSGLPLGRITATGLYGPYAGRANEVQTATITGSPTGGTFTFTLDGETTAAIAYNATAATVQAALLAMSNLNPGDVTVTGSAGGPYTITFAGARKGTDVPALTASASLTGGTTPGVTIATGTAGGSSASDGTETLAGFLFCSVRAPAVNTVDVPAAMLEHAIIVEAKLPIAIDAPGKADVAGRIHFR
jgi:hypothetical protein